MYKLGPYMVSKPCRRSRHTYNIDVGGSGFAVGVNPKHIKAESLVGPHWQDADDFDQDGVCMMKDGKVYAVYEHEDN